MVSLKNRHFKTKFIMKHITRIIIIQDEYSDLVHYFDVLSGNHDITGIVSYQSFRTGSGSGVSLLEQSSIS